jgi:Arc/MetJ-type ribon-helix-helix transcriptional regulator
VADVDKSEKITINVGLVDLGQIDLLVREGFYANRTDFIRTAIRRQLETRASAVDDSVARRALTLGTQHYSRSDLEEVREEAAPLSSASWASRASRTTSLSTSRSPRSRPSRSSGPSGRGGRSRRHSARARCNR